jgi:predicted TIM-barrel fold metal-dependent hydrolase
MATIALEEHFWTRQLAPPPGTGLLARPDGARLDAALIDLDEARIADMDASRIDVQVLSHVQPAAQGPGGGADLVAAAREANDHLAAAIGRHPARLAGFATLPTDSPAAAADELARCTGELGFVGGMVHSTLGTDGYFLDDPRYRPLLSRFESLDVPLYLHPAQPPAAIRDTLYGDLPGPVAGALATNAWGWHAEAGLHALRLVVSGVLERHPGLKLIIGHGGEMIPFMLDRIDDMLPPRVTGLPELPSAYFLRHTWVTTSGMFSLPPVMCALAVFGTDRVLFSVDYPFGANPRGRALLDQLPVSETDRAKIGGANAQRLLRLPS